MTSGAIPDPLADWHRRDPRAPAIARGDETLQVADLEALVAARAGTIAGAIEPNERVGILRTDRLDVAVDVLATIRAGGVAAPLDRHLGTEELLDRVDRGAIVHLRGDDPEPAITERVATIQVGDTERATRGPRSLDPDEPVTLLFTSGTTGTPTPVIHTAWNHAAAAMGSADRLGVAPGDRWYDPLAMHHAGGLAPLTRCLFAQVPVALAERVRRTGHFEAIAATDATIASVVPPMLAAALEAGSVVPDTLRCLLVGGGPLSESRYRRARSADVPVWTTYGLTETLGQVTTATPADRDARPDTVGRPLAGLSITIDDAGAHGGDGGRIVIDGPTIAPGQREPDGRLHTRDRGDRDADGYLYVHGRLDDAIVTGGEVVQPRRVVATLEAHPRVAAAAVIGLDDDRWGERLVAAVVPRGDLDTHTLHDHCASRLEPAARPRSIVTLEELPRTPSGTVDRDALRHRLSK